MTPLESTYFKKREANYQAGRQTQRSKQRDRLWYSGKLECGKHGVFYKNRGKMDSEKAGKRERRGRVKVLWQEVPSLMSKSEHRTACHLGSRQMYNLDSNPGL